jgi:transposase
MSKSAMQRDEMMSLDVVHPNAAGIDIGNATHYVAVPPDRDAEPVRTFECFTEDLNKMADWLAQCGIVTVAMQSTGVYWLPVYEILVQRGLEVFLVNARHTKNLPGRKSDVQECQWLMKLHTYGLLNNSFRPSEEICVLRTYWRQRDDHVKSASASIQRMQKVLTEMNVQIANVITDISGVTGMAILNAILRGERDRYKLAELADPRVKASKEEIAKSLEGNWRPELLFVLRQQMQIYGAFQKRIEECDEALASHLMTMEDKAEPGSQPQTPKAGKKAGGNAPQFNLRGELYRISGIDLTRIDGINVMIAQTIVAEVGLDMSKWPTEAHFASWLGLCPDNKITGGKVYHREAATSRTGRPRPSAWRPRVCGAARRTWERNSNGCAPIWELPKRSPLWPTLWRAWYIECLSTVRTTSTKAWSSTSNAINNSRSTGCRRRPKT